MVATLAYIPDAGHQSGAGLQMITLTMFATSTTGQASVSDNSAVSDSFGRRHATEIRKLSNEWDQYRQSVLSSL
jgi:hypothetical protein